MGLMDKIRKELRNFLAIEESQGEAIVIQETNSFEGTCFRNLIWYRGDASELHQYYTQCDDLMGRAKFWAASGTTGINFRKIHTGLPALIIDTLSDIVIDALNGIDVINNEKGQETWDKIAEENVVKELVKEAIVGVFVEHDGAFRLSYDTCVSKYPILDFWPGSRVDFLYNRR